MQHTALHRHILEKNLDALAQDLHNEKPEVIEELDSQGNNFKTLAIKTLNAQEFDKFCAILEQYYLIKTIGQAPKCMACRAKPKA